MLHSLFEKPSCRGIVTQKGKKPFLCAFVIPGLMLWFNGVSKITVLVVIVDGLNLDAGYMFA